MDSLACDEKPPLIEAIELQWRLLRDIGAGRLDLYTMKRRALGEGFAFFTKTLPTLGKALDMGLGASRFKLPTSFKRWKKATEIPAFLGSLFRRVFADNGVLLAHADPSAVKALRQVCFLFYKYELPFTIESELEGYADWIRTDFSLPESFSTESDEILDRAANLTSDVFGDFAISDLVYKHGPGAVSNCQRIDKHTYSPSPHDPIFQTFPYVPTYHLGSEGRPSLLSPGTAYGGIHLMLSPRILVLVARSISGIFDGRFTAADYCLLLQSAFKRDITSRVITVPKNAMGGRKINIEPCHHQYYQQGIQAWTVKRIENHDYSSGSVNFKDQSVNRNLALRASITLDTATMDLSEASDRVSLALVKSIFSKSPEYLQALLATRTNFAQLRTMSGTVTVQPKKFAAMGSAVCFTTLAWVIYVLILSSLMQGRWNLYEIKSRVYVYGDDIIIPAEWFPYVTSVLEKYGLSVNVKKSFVGARFAESCGMDAFDGVCVTPIRSKCLIKSRSGVAKVSFGISDSERIVKSTKLANELQKGGYCDAANYVYSLVERQLGGPLPFGTEDSPYMCRISDPASFRRLNETSGFIRKTRKRTNGPVSHRLHNRMADYYHDQLDRVRGYGIRAVTVDGLETPYSRLRRVLPTCGGSENSGLPHWGEYTERGFTLERVNYWFDRFGNLVESLRQCTRRLARPQPGVESPPLAHADSVSWMKRLGFA